MSYAKSLIVLAGAAAGLTGAASAQVSNDEVRAIVAEMIADSETRSSLLQGGATAGYDRNFFVGSADGNFRLNVAGQIQFRYVANFRDDNQQVDGGNGGDDFDSGFQTRRTKLEFSGHVVNPNWKYLILGAFSRSTGNFSLEEAFVDYNMGDGWNLKFGQFKLPFLREESVSSRRQLAAERSITNYAFSQTRSQGVELGYRQDAWTAQFAFSDGLQTENTEFTSAAESDYAFTGRFQYMFAGEWDNFKDFTSRQNDPFGLLLGAAAHYQQSANTGAPTDVDTDYLTYTLDVSVEGNSWNLYGAFIGAFTDTETLAADPEDVNDFGAVIQGGYRIMANTELFARWDAIFTDSDRNLAEDNFHFATFGVNQYISGHSAKFTVDAVWALNDTSGLSGTNIVPGTGGILPSTRTGILGSSEENEVALRAQFQLLF